MSNAYPGIQLYDAGGNKIDVTNPLPVILEVGGQVVVTNLYLETTTHANPSIGTEPAASTIIAGTTDGVFPASPGPNSNTRALRVGSQLSTNSLAVVLASDQSAIPVSFQSSTSPFAVNSGASTNATSVKGSAGTLWGLSVSNNSDSAAYLKIYDKASAPSVGTDTPKITYVLAPQSSFTPQLGDQGIPFLNGLALAITGGMADTDTTAVAASQVKVWGTYA